MLGGQTSPSLSFLLKDESNSSGVPQMLPPVGNSSAEETTAPAWGLEGPSLAPGQPSPALEDWEGESALASICVSLGGGWGAGTLMDIPAAAPARQEGRLSVEQAAWADLGCRNGPSSGVSTPAPGGDGVRTAPGTWDTCPGPPLSRHYHCQEESSVQVWGSPPAAVLSSQVGFWILRLGG